MLGIGWQELVIIGISLVMCIGFLVTPVALMFWILFKVRTARLKHRQPVTVDPSPPPPRPHPTPDPYETKYGFDAADWGSKPDDDADDEPRIVRRQ